MCAQWLLKDSTDVFFLLVDMVKTTCILSTFICCLECERLQKNSLLHYSLHVARWWIVECVATQTLCYGLHLLSSQMKRVPVQL
jgi:hypothetical protein